MKQQLGSRKNLMKEIGVGLQNGTVLHIVKDDQCAPISVTAFFILVVEEREG
jgi:hypothetical protein